MRATAVAALALLLTGCPDFGKARQKCDSEGRCSDPEILSDGGLADGGALQPLPVCSTNGWCWATALPHQEINAIWGAADDDVWGVGDVGTLFHYDGKSWTAQMGPIAESLQSIWGSSANDIWAVGNYGAMVHYDGTKWSPEVQVVAVNLNGISGVSNHDITAVGDYGTIVRYDGSRWLDYPTAINDHLRDVAMTSDSEAFAVGQNGIVLRFDGSQWSDGGVQAPGDLSAIHARSSSDVWTAGANGTLLHWNGSQWQAAAGADGNDDLVTLWSNGTGPVLGGTYFSRALFELKATGWQRSLGLPFVTAVGGAKGGSGWLAAGRLAIYKWNGGLPEPVVSELDNDLYAVSLGTDGTIFGVGYGGSLLRQVDGKWKIESAGTTETLWDVWTNNASSAWACGSQGTVFHWNGTAWLKESPGSNGPLNGVWGDEAGNAVAVGNFGTVFQRKNGVWSEISPGTVNSNLLDVHATGPSDVWAVGETGLLLHYNGQSWNQIDVGTGDDLGAVFALPDEVLVGGKGDTFFRVSGTTVTQEDTGMAGYARIRGIWANGHGDAWAVSESGEASHYNGTGWAASETCTGNHLTGVVEKPNGDVVAVGEAGTIIEKRAGP